MPNKTFLDFEQKTLLTGTDYIVGYKADGTAEFRSTLLNLAQYVQQYLITPTYALGASGNPVDEGISVTFTLSTTNVDNGTLVPYTITGISSEDLSSGSLTGNFNISNKLASATITLSSDRTTEGSETAILALDNGEASISVTINDTSLTPIYSLTRSASAFDEGSSITFTLSTANVDAGTLVPYTITGISFNDLTSGSLMGNFAIGSNGQDSIVLTASADSLTEGNETMTFSTASQSLTALINDTSLTPTYSLSRSASTIDEGSSVTFTLNTTNVADGTNVPYTITGISSEDLSSGSLTGNFVINSNQGTVTLTAAIDSLTEGNETLTIAAGGQTSSITINDTSTTPIPTGYILSYDSTDALSYSGTGSRLNNTLGVASLSGTVINSPSYSGTTKSFTWNNTSYIRSGNFTGYFPQHGSTNFYTQTPITLEVWAKPTKTNCVLTSIANDPNENSGGWHSSFMDIENGKVNYRLWMAAQLTSPTTVTTNAWHQFVITYDGSVMKGYLDGQLQVTSNSFAKYGFPTGGSAYLLFGNWEASSTVYGWTDPTNRFGGEWGAISLYNVGKSAQWVLDSYNNNISKFS